MSNYELVFPNSI